MYDFQTGSQTKQLSLNPEMDKKELCYCLQVFYVAVTQKDGKEFKVPITPKKGHILSNSRHRKL